MPKKTLLKGAIKLAKKAKSKLKSAERKVSGGIGRRVSGVKKAKNKALYKKQGGGRGAKFLSKAEKDALVGEGRKATAIVAGSAAGATAVEKALAKRRATNKKQRAGAKQAAANLEKARAAAKKAAAKKAAPKRFTSTAPKNVVPAPKKRVAPKTKLSSAKKTRRGGFAVQRRGARSRIGR